MSNTIFDERLIDLVEQNDVLYNKENVCYQSLTIKKKVWANIAEQLESTEEQVIKRYRELRDRFVRSKRMELIRGEQSRKLNHIVTRMNFLTPHIFNKRSNAKVTWTGDVPVLTPALERSQEESNYSDTDSFDEYSYEENCASADIIKEEPEIQTMSESEYLDDSAISTGSDTELFAEAFQSFNQLCKSLGEPTQNEGALNGFVQMIMATIEAMSPNKQIKAMMRVTEVVMKIKMEEE
ncbi:uncharacterized protein LOC142226687 [Haematobia irritans]|uniref:uncharacterized protein LOC142226687 n=1 Tax=Haematobia irritans TaxID=7368 RepID=UPI003F4F90B2